MIKIKNLSKKFGSQLVLDDINLQMSKNDSIIIMGQNGAGKTTLIRTILGEYIPTVGSVEIEGVNPIKNREMALLNLGFVPQLPPPIKLSVEELIRYTVSSGKADKEKIILTCKEMDLDINAHLNKIFFKLSGGMKQKLLISIAIAREPKIFIFDEPTANLDPKGRESFYNIIKSFKEDRLLVFISHRVEELAGLVNRKIEMDLAKVVKDEKI
ncbi:MAG: ATP-binding cassette domain-containing protein [Campylobacteraceae bacterium]